MLEVNNEKEDYSSMIKSEWSNEFEKFMRNRLLVGSLRYGKLNSEKPVYARVRSIEKRLSAFKETKNKEILVDIANLCMLEFEEGDGEFNALDGSEHTSIKGV
ncbi:MAG: hypothetical protein WC516_06960 [Patescibacteria group bacterium]|jgi:hypothetical protein